MVEQVVVTGIEVLADVGIGYMVGTIARAMTPENANALTKTCICLGGMALGGAASVAANDYIEDYANTVKTAVTNIKLSRKVKKMQKEAEANQKEKEEKKVETEQAKEEAKAEKPKKKTKKEAV